MTQQDLDKLTPKQVVEMMSTDTPLAKARRAFSQGMARIENSHAQARGLNIIEQRRMEFKIVLHIAHEAGIDL